MPQFISVEDAAASVASGLLSSASGINGPGDGFVLRERDTYSQYGGNTIAQEKIKDESANAQTATSILNCFVELIHSTASEFVGMDAHIANEIAQTIPREKIIPRNSAVPNSAEIKPDFQPNDTLFVEGE